MNRTAFRGGIAAGIVGVLVMGLGLVLNNQAQFSDRYVRSQLVEHNIRFSPVANLRGTQKQVPCLVENAGKQLTTAKQAECYARYQVGVDMLSIDGGKGYSETHYAAYLLKLKANEAVKARPDDPATATLVKQSQELTSKGDELLAGEAVKGLLLTAYGFGLIGERGGQAAMACFGIAGLLLLVALVSLAVAARSRRQVTAAAPVVDRTAGRPDPVPVG